MEVSSVKGIFLRYIMMPLFAVIMMVVLGAIRRNRPAVKIKTMIIYFLLCSLCLAIPGIFGFTGNLFNPYWYLIAQIVYLILGIVHVNLSDRYFKKHFTSTAKGFLFESILTLTCIGFGGYLFYLIFNWMSKGTGYPVMAATSLFIFMVPLVFHYCYVQLISIPVDIYKTWKYSPDQKLPDFEGADFDRLMVLNVELSKNLEEANRFRIKAKTLPTGVTFGDWFYRVVDDYNHKNPNSVIHLTDETQEPFYWIFYTKKSFFSFRKYIDFEQDITENSIHENDVVICKKSHPARRRRNQKNTIAHRLKLLNMIQPIKHFAINWVDGMKVSQRHLNDQDNFLIDTIRDSNSLGITNFNYGLLPISSEFTDRTIFDVHNTATNDVQLVIKRCSAVTMAGYRIELIDRRVSVKSLAKSMNEEQADGEYYILISVNPFDKVPFGDIDPEEIPPRHPNTQSNHHLELLPVTSLNSSYSGGNYLIIGKVGLKGNIAQVDSNFIPPCTSIQSHPALQDYYNIFAKSVGNLQQYAFKIIQKASHKNQNTALAQNVKFLCNTMINTFGDMYFQFRNITPYQPPVFLIESFAKLALRMYNATQVLVPAELEEMLNYSLEWSEIAPHTLLNQLSIVAETNYDHHNCGEPFIYIQQMLKSLETIFAKLSELDYIGQRKENIIVNEQEVSNNNNPKRGWSVLD